MSEKHSTEVISRNVRRISDAAKAAAHDAGVQDLRVMAVTKNRTVEEIEAVRTAGIGLFGENRVQQFREKQSYFESCGAEVHMIGHLQRNKVKYIVGNVACIESIDTLGIAETVGAHAERLGIVQPVLLEVNTGSDPAKFGFSVEELYSSLDALSRITGISVRGLMTVPPIGPPEKTRDVFLQTRELFIDIANKKIDNMSMCILSMGMSSDYLDAIACGANLVRIGSAFFDDNVN